MKISEFRIIGLFGDRDVALPLEGNTLVLVGPNGLGKSSVASIFYLACSRQWQRLLDYNFNAIEVTIGARNLAIQRDEISGLVEFNKTLPGIVRSYVEKLASSNLLEKFVSSETLPPSLRNSAAAALNIPSFEIRRFHNFLVRHISESPPSLFSAPRLELEKILTDAVPDRILYLPTYRRIEKDIRDVFPEFDFDKARRYSGQDVPLEAGRSGNFYVELVNFGMEDVKKSILKSMEDLRNYSLSQYNNLSGSYLRDVIRGNAGDYAAATINVLGDAEINSILGRVSETTISAKDKEVLRKRIRGVQSKKKSDTEMEDRYLAHYFSKLVSVTKEIQNHENQIQSFVDVCNKYFSPSKSIVYNEVNFSLNVVNEKGSQIDWSALSSGEKQIVSLFCHFYLGDAQNEVVVIDEPELSLSVPWQRNFLPDIAATRQTNFILAVTHSPFIYDNDLKPAALDMRRLTTMRG